MCGGGVCVRCVCGGVRARHAREAVSQSAQRPAPGERSSRGGSGTHAARCRGRPPPHLVAKVGAGSQTSMKSAMIALREERRRKGGGKEGREGWRGGGRAGARAGIRRRHVGQGAGRCTAPAQGRGEGGRQRGPRPGSNGRVDTHTHTQPSARRRPLSRRQDGGRREGGGKEAGGEGAGRPRSHDQVGKHKVQLALEVVAALGVLCRCVCVCVCV